MTTPSLLFTSRFPSLLRTLFALMLLTGLAAPQLCHAQAPAPEKSSGGDLKTRYGRAVTLYNTGQYDKAIEEFQAVYEMRAEPILLFNLAQAHRKAGHKAKALDLYERFQRENQDPEPKLKSETELYINELRAAVEADKAAARAAEEKLAAEKAAAEKAAADKALAEKQAAEQAAEFRRKHGPTRPLNIAKWATLGLGVAMVVVGGVLIGLDGKPVCSAELPQMDGQKLCPNELDTRVGGGIALALGVASLGTSAALFVVDYKQTRDMQPQQPMVALNASF